MPQLSLYEQITMQFARPSLADYTSALTADNRITPAVQEALDRAQRIQQNYDIAFYIAGALTGVDEVIKQRYADLSQLVEQKSRPNLRMFGYTPHMYGTDPVTHPDVTPAEVRDIDYLWSSIVAHCHFNFWAPIAHGNGIEAAWAEAYKVPIVSIVPDNVTTSRLVRGLRNNALTITYKNFQKDGLPQLADLLDKLQKSKK